MALKLPEICERADKIAPGHRACLGCGETIVVRQVLHAIDEPLVVGTPTGCLEIVTSPFPFTSWRIPWIHNLFENAATTIAGVEAAYKALVRKGELEDRGIKFLVFAGDGATYDIGLQWLSGVLERGHRMLYVCLNNEAYMNCLSTSSLIMTKDGLKKITEVKEGDEIYAFHQKTHQPISKKCAGVFDNGEREVFELETLHHSIRATPNHPFLVPERNGWRENEFVWKTLSQLSVGDKVVVTKMDEREFFAFDPALMQREDEINLIENDYFKVEKISSIEPIGREPTLDLRVEDEHNFIADGIVVHNTGIQRSSATPLGAWTTTTPVGKVLPGKVQHRKDLTFIIYAHNIPYVAQGAPHAWRDLMTKVKKAIAANGPSFMNVLAPCPRGWRYNPEETIGISLLSTETCMWPLFEVENGTWKLNFKPAKKKPITDWLKSQGRFAHLLRPENRWIVDELQARTDRDWNDLLKRCGVE